MTISERLKEFVENEARSCSMDFGCVTPEYVFRSWGGSNKLPLYVNSPANVSIKKRLKEIQAELDREIG